MAVRPSDIVVIPDGGSANMGDVTDSTSPARFTLDADRFLLVFVRYSSERIQNTAGADKADLTIKVDRAGPTAQYNHTLKTIKDFGPTGTASSMLRIAEEEQSQWVFARGDVIVLEWTNPDPVDIRWAVEVGLADASGF